MSRWCEGSRGTPSSDILRIQLQVRHFEELFHELFHGLFGALALEVVPDLVGDLLVGDGAFRLLFEDLGDVPAEAGFEGFADLPDGEGEDRIGEIRRHAGAGKPIEIASLIIAARIFRMGFGEGFESASPALCSRQRDSSGQIY